MNKKIRVFIVDDHQLFRDGIKAMFLNDDEIEIVADSGNADDLVKKIKKASVEVLLLDMFLPKPEGLTISKRINEACPDISVVVLSSNTEEELIVGAFQTGAKGYVQKDIEKAELKKAIKEAYDGRDFVSEKIQSNLSNSFVYRAKYGDKFAQSKLTVLTERELEIVQLIAQGLIYKEIGAELNISPRTVEAHKANILEKLELNSIVDLVKFAIKNKIVDL